MWMPNMPITLTGTKKATAVSPATATFRVLPRMTKHEIKEYLTKIYDLPVKKVNTVNYMGKRKRAMGRRKVIYYKYRDFKKAIVTFNSSLTDLGRGVELEQPSEKEVES
jgi:large subunit ribosomal protein L23